MASGQRQGGVGGEAGLPHRVERAGRQGHRALYRGRGLASQVILSHTVI